MGDSEEHGASGSEKGMQLQGGSSSSSSGGGVVVGGGAWRVNKEVTLPILMVLKESLEEEIKQVKSLINIVHGEEILVEEEKNQMAQQREIQRKALADEQDRSLELEMQLEVMKLTISCGFSGRSGGCTSD